MPVVRLIDLVLSTIPTTGFQFSAPARKSVAKPIGLATGNRNKLAASVITE
jgi:hypothetical protein